MAHAQLRNLSPQANRFVRVNQIAALMMLIPILPLAILIVFAIVIDSGFPVFFSQERLGLHGRRFRMLKFRKFRATVGRNTSPLTLDEDSRFTRVGKFLAKTKLDELPQIWNVVRREMAFVGPRPEVPEFEACFEGAFHQVLDYRPGIFGPSQAASRAESALYPPDQDPQDFYRAVLFPAKAAFDLAYYPSRTTAGDLKWILRGILAVCGAHYEFPLSLVVNASRPAQTEAMTSNKPAV